MTVRYGMVIDLKKCTGCQTCTIACKVENATRPGVFWNKCFDYEVGKFPNVSRHFLPRPCMHCKNAACVDVCPTGATSKRDDGIVMIDYDKCIGCRYCLIACPYGARSFNSKNGGYFPEGLTPYEEAGYSKHQLGVVEKCTFCEHRLAEGKLPACVHNCPGLARFFGDLNDPDSEVSRLVRLRRGQQLREEVGTDPSVYYLL